MTLPRKMLVLFVGWALVLLAACWLLLATVLRPMADEMDRRAAERGAGIVEAALAAKHQDLARRARDWAVWDDPWRELAGTDRSFSRLSLLPEHLTAIDIDAAWIERLDGQVVALASADGSRAAAELQPGLTRAPAFATSIPGAVATSIVSTPQGPALAAVVAVTNSEGTAVPDGRLVMLQYFDEGRIAQLGRLLSINFSLVPVRTLDEDTARRVVDNAVHVLSPDTLTAYRQVRDATGRITHAIVVRKERTGAALAAANINLTTLVMVVLSALTLVVAIGLMHLMFGRPLRRLRQAVLATTEAAPFDAARLDARGDEIGHLARAFHDLDSAARGDRAALLGSLDAARAADEAKSRFLAVMSHEIRTPLNGVLGAASILKAREDDPERLRLIETMQSSGDVLMRLLDDVLDLSRLERGEMEVASQGFAPRELARDIEEIWSRPASTKGLALTVSVAEIVPPRLRADASRLRQAVFHLVSNAVKFTEQGTIDVRFGWSEERLTVEVVDTGCGITESIRTRMFESFAMADASNTRRQGGAGVGLALVRHLVDLMGGEVSVESRPGSGSMFVIVLPCMVDALDDGAWDLNDDPVEGDAPLAGLRVLVAEDNSVNRLIAGKLLETVGAHAVFAENGALALELAAAEGFDLVLMDVQMPVMDGLEAARALRDREGPNRFAPIVALTANAGDRDRRTCLEAGMDDFVTKPIQPAALFAAMQRAVSSRRLADFAIRA